MVKHLIETQKMKVGIIGCGAIGTLIAEAAERGLVICDELILYDFDAKSIYRG